MGGILMVNVTIYINLPTSLWLWLLHSHGIDGWPIEIDDFPSERNLHLWLGFSMAMLNNQMVSYMYIYIYIYANIKGVYWWDPCYQYSSTMDPMGINLPTIIWDDLGDRLNSWVCHTVDILYMCPKTIQNKGAPNPFKKNMRFDQDVSRI